MVMNGVAALVASNLSLPSPRTNQTGRRQNASVGACETQAGCCTVMPATSVTCQPERAES
jgi:hypothetical protein